MIIRRICFINSQSKIKKIATMFFSFILYLFANNGLENIIIEAEYPLYGDTTQPVEFQFIVSNVESKELSYQIDWGDKITEWSNYFSINYGYNQNHLYKEPGMYPCKIRVKDKNNNISSWSQSFPITIIPNLLKWQYLTNSGIYSAVSIGFNDEIYITCEDGTLHSLNSNGTLRWKIQLLPSIYSSPVVGKKAIYITTTNGRLYAIDINGKEKWQYNVDNPIYTTPAVDNKDNIYFGCDDANIYCISPNGEKSWSYKTGDEIAGSLIISDDKTIYCASDAVYALDLKGKRKWVFKPSEDDDVYFYASPFLGNDNTIYIAGTDGALYALTNNGRLKWKEYTEDEDEIRASGVIDQDQNIFFGDENGIIYKKRMHHNIEFFYETDYYIFSAPAIDQLNNIYLVSDDGYFYCLNKDGKLLFKWQIAEDSKEIMYSPSPIIDKNGTVYIGSWEGKLFAFNGFAPPMTNTWSLYRYNAQNTGCKIK